MAHSSSGHLLPQDASAKDKWHALRLNAEAWYERYALALPKGKIQKVGDVLLTRNSATIPTETSVLDDPRLDAILDWYRSQPEPGSTIIWYLDPRSPSTELKAKLLARGVCTNWEPHWMWCNLADSPIASQPSVTFDIAVVKAGDGSISAPEEDRVTDRIAELNPGLVWRIAAFDGGEQVGGCVVNTTTGRYGVCGLFDMYVDPEHQRKGIGSALVAASRSLAKELGYHHMYLNSTGAGESIYRQGCFVSMGYGTTWHLRDGFQNTEAPSGSFVKFLAALGQGRTAELDELSGSVTLAEMENKTINTMTPLEIAVHLSQPESAAWLMNHGVTPDVISLWDLGWKDAAHQLITNQSNEVNRKGGDHNGTPLHTAVERDDVELAQMLLGSPHIDLTIMDDVFFGTPLRWAEVLKRENVLALLQS